MNNISNIEKLCCGCRACESVCNLGAISFMENAEGFMYPCVDKEKCVSCGKCQNVCPIVNISTNKEEQLGYAAFLNDPVLLEKSSSGGVFTAIAKYVLEQGGVVFGCGLDSKGLPFHMKINREQDLDQLKGSKYCQSNMERVYQECIAQIKNGTLVLFSGTPCQVAGLKNLVKDEYNNLLTCDLICHGVPSRLLLKKYYEWLEHHFKGQLLQYSFRSKERNNWSLTYRADMKKKDGKRFTIENIASIDPYYDSFLKAKNYRESCYQCPYSQRKRPGDITIGDFWGIENEFPNSYNYNGNSSVLVNTVKGQSVFANISQYLVSIPVDVDAICKNNGNLNKPSERPSDRETYYTTILEDGFDAYYRQMKKSKRFKIETLRNILPNSVRQKIKKILHF